MQWSTLMGFLLTTAVVVAVPGPNILLITHDSIRHGVKKASLTIAGVNAGMVLLFALSLAGISTLVLNSAWGFGVLRLAGAGYLVFLGGSQILAATKKGGSPEMNPGEHGDRRFFLKGFLISATNPKGLVFAGAFFPQFLDARSSLLPQVVLLCLGSLLVASLISMAYAVFARSALALFDSPSFGRAWGAMSGALLMGIGISLLFAGRLQIM